MVSSREGANKVVYVRGHQMIRLAGLRPQPHKGGSLRPTSLHSYEGIFPSFSEVIKSGFREGGGRK